MAIKELPSEYTSGFRSEVEYLPTQIILRTQNGRWLCCDSSGDVMFSCFIHNENETIIKRSGIISNDNIPRISIEDEQLIVSLGTRKISFGILTKEELNTLPLHIREMNRLLGKGTGVQTLVGEIGTRIRSILIHDGKLYESFSGTKL